MFSSTNEENSRSEFQIPSPPRTQDERGQGKRERARVEEKEEGHRQKEERIDTRLEQPTAAKLFDIDPVRRFPHDVAAPVGFSVAIFRFDSYSPRSSSSGPTHLCSSLLPFQDTTLRRILLFRYLPPYLHACVLRLFLFLILPDSS